MPMLFCRFLSRYPKGQFAAGGAHGHPGHLLARASVQKRAIGQRARENHPENPLLLAGRSDRRGWQLEHCGTALSASYSLDQSALWLESPAPISLGRSLLFCFFHCIRINWLGDSKLASSLWEYRKIGNNCCFQHVYNAHGFTQQFSSNANFRLPSSTGERTWKMAMGRIEWFDKDFIVPITNQNTGSVFQPADLIQCLKYTVFIKIIFYSNKNSYTSSKSGVFSVLAVTPLFEFSYKGVHIGDDLPRLSGWWVFHAHHFDTGCHVDPQIFGCEFLNWLLFGFLHQSDH